MREELLRADLPEEADDGELTAEVSLRPRTSAEFVGQGELKEHLEVMLEAARRRGQAVDHLLLRRARRAWARPPWPASSPPSWG